jgi:hypothetical protein
MSDENKDQSSGQLESKQPVPKAQIVTILIIVIGFFIVFGYLKVTAPPEKPLSPADERKMLIEKHFSAWDGSHKGLEKLIKNSMHDPQSYEHIKTIYFDNGSYLLVQTEFRGKNTFGAVVKNQVRAKVGLDGEILKILDQQ